MFGEKLIKLCYTGGMVLFGRFICALVALSFIFAGTPVLAKPQPCPMEKMQMEMQMSGMDCDECPEMQAQKQTDTSGKNGCCDDAACNTKCMTSTSSAKLPSVASSKWVSIKSGTRMEALSDLLLPSLRGKTPEKPPKYLS